jgi:predicted ATPase/tetratricopeptide (TPR) repeat protein
VFFPRADSPERFRKEHIIMARLKLNLVGSFEANLDDEPPGISVSPAGSEWGSRPALSASVDLHNVPLQLTPFVGREAELARLTDLLLDPDYRLLTLVGPGGVGKTRLALAAAEEAVHSFAEGVWFVPLTEVNGTDRSCADALLTAIASALRVPLRSGIRDMAFAGQAKDQLLGYLRWRQVLLLLDGFEQIVGAEADLLLELLHGAPHVTLLVTSRQPLNLQGECAIRLDGLPVPDLQDLGNPADPSSLERAFAYDSVKLFVERATRRPAGFALSEKTLPGVVEICQLVEGLPLGIELAAAQIEHASPAEIACAIRHNLDVLATSMLDVPPRHRSMRAVFEGSWRLLSDMERSILTRASVFRGGFSLPAAERILPNGNGASKTALGPGSQRPNHQDPIPNTLSSLLAKSLLRQSATGRYEMHGLVRRFAAEKLRDPAPSGPGHRADPLQHLHCAHYLDLVARQEEALHQRHPQAACAEIRQEWDNIQEAWDWAVGQGHTSHLARCLPAVARYLTLQTLFELGERLCSQAAENLSAWYGSEVLALQGRLLVTEAQFANAQGHSQRASRSAQQALALARTGWAPALEAEARLQWGIALIRLGDLTGARRQCEEALVRARADRDPALQAAACNALGQLALSQGDWEGAEQHFVQGLTLANAAGDWPDMALSLLHLSDVARERGEPGKTARLAEESLALYRELDDPQGINAALHNRGVAARQQGNHETVVHCFTEYLTNAREMGDQRSVSVALNNLGAAAYSQGEYREAACYLQEALTLTLSQTVGLHSLMLKTLTTLGMVYTALGDAGMAWSYLQRGLQESVASGTVHSALSALVGVASLRARLGEHERAAELLGFALEHPALEADVKEITAGPILTLLSEALPSSCLQAALARGEALELDAVVTQILATDPAN